MANPTPDTSGLTHFDSETGRAASNRRWRRVREDEDALVEQAIEAGFSKSDLKRFRPRWRQAIIEAERRRMLKAAERSRYRNWRDEDRLELALTVLTEGADSGDLQAANVLARLLQTNRQIGMAQEAGESMGVLSREDEAREIVVRVRRRRERLAVGSEEKSDG